MTLYSTILQPLRSYLLLLCLSSSSRYADIKGEQLVEEESIESLDRSFIPQLTRKFTFCINIFGAVAFAN